MSRFQSLFAWSRSLSRRERRVVAGGLLVSGLALFALWAALPFIERWQGREALIAAKQVQLGQLQALVRGEATRREELRTRQERHDAVRGRLLAGATPALAASNLQALLQSYADGSRVTLDRVDVVAQPDAVTTGRLSVIPVSLSGQGDIYGVVDLLTRFQQGEKLLVVDELRLSRGSSETGPGLLSFSLRLHGAYSAD